MKCSPHALGSLVSLALLVGCGGASSTSSQTSGAGGSGAPVTRIYATIVSHNEEDSNASCKNGPNNDPAKYAANRALLKALAEGIVARGGAYDQQNEWKFLSRVADASYETPALEAETGGKNILAYIAGLDPERVSVDVHHHPTKFSNENYADVAGRLLELGIVEQGVVGGFLFSPASASEVDTMRAYAEQGQVSNQPWGGQKVTWKPKILWGGGSANHTGDSPASGVWRPKSSAEFYLDDPSSPLPNVGNYEGNLDFSGMAELVAKVEGGEVPEGSMLTVTLMVNQCELTAASVQATLAEIEKYSYAVTKGYVMWKTIPGIVEEWQSVYGGKPQIYGAP